MSAKSFRKIVVLAVSLIVVSAGYARADKLGLQEKLSKDVKIQLKDVTIAEALEKIGEKAGVTLVLSDEAAWKLPQGEATRLSVALDGPLAESMTEMFNAFFMRYAAGDEEITIYPRPELEHILGRPTAKQLNLLTAIYTNTVANYIESPQNTINVALGEYVAVVPYKALDKIDSILHQLAYKDRTGPPRPENYGFELLGPMTVANILEHLGGSLEWYLSGVDFTRQVPEIRVVSSGEFREAKLDQIVDISFKYEKEEVVLQRLAKWVGMEVVIQKMETSWLSERISVDMQNIKLRHAMRNIVSTIDGDISFDISDNEIGIAGPIHVKKPAPPKAVVSRTATRRPRSSTETAGEDYVGKISIPMDGGKYFIEFMLRENDLTEELKKLREEKMKEILGEKESKPKVKKKSSD